MNGVHLAPGNNSHLHNTKTIASVSSATPNADNRTSRHDSQQAYSSPEVFTHQFFAKF